MDEVKFDDGDIDFRFSYSDLELFEFLDYLSWAKLDEHTSRDSTAVIEVVKGRGTSMYWIPRNYFCFSNLSEASGMVASTARLIGYWFARCLNMFGQNVDF